MYEYHKSLTYHCYAYLKSGGFHTFSQQTQFIHTRDIVPPPRTTHIPVKCYVWHVT